MADDSSDNSAAAEIAIVGGGCYGSFYVRQLERAREKGAVAYHRLLIVDRDAGCQMARELGERDDRRLVVAEWGDFLDEWLSVPRDTGGASGHDAIVPSPLMPHLMYEWLLRRARARWPGRAVGQRPLLAEAGTPYDMLAPDGTRYVSFADWICPTHCVEPALCPAIRAPRTWEMSEALETLRERLDRRAPTAGPVLFQCRHRAYGVGMFDAAAVQAGDQAVTRAGASGAELDVLVGTISSCHGAASLLHLGAA
jgi:hypothetical protein